MVTVYVLERYYRHELDMFELYSTAELAHDQKSRLASEIDPDDHETWFQVRPVSVLS